MNHLPRRRPNPGGRVLVACLGLALCLGGSATAAPTPAAAAGADAAPAGVALPAADAKEVRRVVEAQLAAFAANDAERAFGLASPQIRQMFGDAGRFIEMVKARYAVVARPASVEFMPARRVGGETIQAARMVDERGTPWLAVYRLERQKDRSWRIAGCELVEVAGRAT